MSWICDICSSSNDDSLVECFVCGQHRSETSIREAKQREKEIKRKEKAEQVFKYSTKTAQTIFIVSVSVSTLFVTIMLMLLAISGNLSTLVSNGIAVGKHFGCSIKQSFGDNLGHIFSRIYDSSISNFSENIRNVIRILISSNALEIDEKIVFITDCFKKSVSQFKVCIVGLFSVFEINIKTMIAIMMLFVRNLCEQFSNMFDQLDGLLNKVIDKKNLFN